MFKINDRIKVIGTEFPSIIGCLGYIKDPSHWITDQGVKSVVVVMDKDNTTWVLYYHQVLHTSIKGLWRNFRYNYV